MTTRKIITYHLRRCVLAPLVILILFICSTSKLNAQIRSQSTDERFPSYRQWENINVSFFDLLNDGYEVVQILQAREFLFPRDDLYYYFLRKNRDVVRCSERFSEGVAPSIPSYNTLHCARLISPVRVQRTPSSTTPNRTGN